MQVSMELKGLDQLDTKLAKLGKAVGKKALRGAMMKATAKTSKKAKAITPVGRYKKPRKDRTPGTLKKAIQRKTMVGRSQDNHSMAVRIRFNRKKAFYWAFVTGGTKPHDLNSGSKKSRNQIGFKRNKSSTLKKRLHPGIKGRDILGIAFRLTQRGMEKTFADDLAKRINQAV